MSNIARAGSAHPKLPRPLFDEPLFGEEIATPDPTTFSTRHLSDNATYGAIHDLLKTKAVSFAKSRLAPGDLYELETAYVPSGPKLIETIKKSGRIVFHA